MSGTDISEWIVLTFAVATVSITLTKTHLFQPFRAWLVKKRSNSESVILWAVYHWFSRLLECPYCVAHWVSLTGVLVFNTRLVETSFIPLDYFVSALAVTSSSTLVILLLWLGFRKLQRGEQDG